MSVIGSWLGRATRAAFIVCAIWLGLASSGTASATDSPGAIMNVCPLEGGGPGNSEAFRILYRSTGLNGEPPGLRRDLLEPRSRPRRRP